MLSCSGSFLPDSATDSDGKLGSLTVICGLADGRIVGGSIRGAFVADSTVQVHYSCIGLPCSAEEKVIDGFAQCHGG